MKRPLQSALVRVALSAPIALLLMTSTSTAGPSTDPTCWFSRWPDTVRQIDVYVDTSVDNGVQTVAYNPIYVAKATEIAVERWNEQAGIPQRLVYAGFTAGNTLSPNRVIIHKGGCAGEALGAASGGCTQTNGVCTTGDVRLFEAPNSVCGHYHYADDYSDANNQGGFVDLLVHELGHTLGRTDAYNNPCGVSNQTTVMETNAVQRRDLTDFDRSESQAVYGSRAATNVLTRRMLASTTLQWGAPVNEGTGNFDIAPGPGSSYAVTAIPVTLVRFVSTTTQLVLKLYNGTQSWAGETTLIGQFLAKKPISTSFAPSGDGVMAYMAENGGNDSTRRLCVRRLTSGTWSAESCSNPCDGQLPNNSVSTAYDPSSGRFLVAHACETPQTSLQVRVSALATSVNCTALRCAEVSTLLNISAAETPVVACGPYNTTLNGTSYGYSNCRLVYAQRNVVGQKIAWRWFGFVPADDWTPSSHLSFGSEYQTQIETEHAPAVTWYVDAFQMALSLHGTSIPTYYQLPSSSQWTYDGTLNTTGWVSPPFYSPSQYCVTKRYFTNCYDQQHVFWLQYR